MEIVIVSNCPGSGGEKHNQLYLRLRIDSRWAQLPFMGLALDEREDKVRLLNFHKQLLEQLQE
jgi:hypothetical protein